jgi:hypothetical protein
MIHSEESLSARQVRRKGAAGSCHPKEEGGEALNGVAVSLRLGQRARCSVLAVSYRASLRPLVVSITVSRKNFLSLHLHVKALPFYPPAVLP